MTKNIVEDERRDEEREEGSGAQAGRESSLEGEGIGIQSFLLFFFCLFAILLGRSHGI